MNIRQGQATITLSPSVGGIEVSPGVASVGAVDWEASSAAISWSTASMLRFSRFTPKGCLTKYQRRSSKPLKYQLKSTVLYLSVCWKASTALAAIVFNFSLTTRSCSSFSNVSYLSALRSSPKDLTFSLTKLASSIAAIKSFFNLEFSTSRASTLDIAEVIFAS